MKRHTAPGLALAALLVGGLPAALAAQASEINADNTPYGTTSGEFLLLGASARGAALGNAFQAIANDVIGPVLQPGRRGHDGRARVSSSAPIRTWPTPGTAGAAWPSRSRAAPGRSASSLGTFGFKDQPVYTVDLPDGTGATYSVSETYIGLTYAENFSDRFSAGFTAKGVFDQLGEMSRQRLRRRLRHQLPLGAEQPPDQVLLRHPEPRHAT